MPTFIQVIPVLDVGVSLSTVTNQSACPATSWALGAVRAPAWIKDWQRSAVRFQTQSSCPPSSSRLAMAPPRRPVPNRAMAMALGVRLLMRSSL
mgnify:CR=1 FL=1